MATQTMNTGGEAFVTSRRAEIFQIYVLPAVI